MVNNNRGGMPRTIKLFLCFICLYQLALFDYIQSPTIRARDLRERSKLDNLVVYNSLGRQHNLALVEHSRRNVFKKEEWDCVAFMFGTEERIPDNDEYLITLRDELGCSISRTPGVQWGNFLQFVTPTFVSNYDYVALVLDDIFIPDRGKGIVNPNKMIENMKKFSIDVMSPSIVADGHGLREVAKRKGFDGCLMEVDMIETFVQFFSRDAWECYYKMLHYTGGKGWCYDLCFQSQCPDLRMAQDFSMISWHMDKGVAELPRGGVLGTNLTEWKPEPSIKMSSSAVQSRWNVCDRLGCDRNFSYGMRKISCPDDLVANESATKPKSAINSDDPSLRPHPKDSSPPAFENVSGKTDIK